ncbi:hypothetical protein SAMN06265346_10327 [Flavobacterium hercynium]|nr:hypothetical protein SAMN06265346_10327 [Flavobacterium hercynium]
MKVFTGKVNLQHWVKVEGNKNKSFILSNNKNISKNKTKIIRSYKPFSLL